MAAATWKPDRGTFFYLAMGWTALGAAIAGFSTTYLMPMAGARFEGPGIAHLHGLLFFTWVILMVVQPLLVRRQALRLHRKLGLLALVLAPAMAASGVGVGLYAVQRDVSAGLGGLAYSTLIGVLTAMSIFVLFVAIGLHLRNRPDWHKRMMLLATIAILWPAWFRFRHFMPWVPNPEIWLALVLADIPILIAMLRDRLRFGRVHPAYLIFGTALIANHVLEVIWFDTPGWRAAAMTAYAALT